LRISTACAIFACSLGAAQIAVAQSNPVLAAAALPNAPQPMAAASMMAAADAVEPVDMGGSDVSGFFLATSGSKYSTVLNPGQKRVPFTVREKFIYSASESVDTEEFIIVMASAGYDHLVNNDPKYGTDGNGFGERVGTTALREASVHLLGDFAFASVLHQDPRYFRVGPGKSFVRRLKYVIASAVTSHSDRDGHLQPDYSGITARAATAAMTLTYYPHVSATNTIAAETFGYSLLGDMAGNALLEFLPDFLVPIRKVEQKAEREVKN
jgi:hypothetical protein